MAAISLRWAVALTGRINESRKQGVGLWLILMNTASQDSLGKAVLPVLQLWVLGISYSKEEWDQRETFYLERDGRGSKEV